VVTLSQAVYRYLNIIVPLQVTGSGIDSTPTNNGITCLPQASVIGAGGPGLIASAGQETVIISLGGGSNPPL